MLHLTGECKRRTITRYERGNRITSEKQLKELSKILLVDSIIIKNYDFKEKRDLIYFFLWLDELFPKVEIYLNTYNDELKDNNVAEDVINTF